MDDEFFIQAMYIAMKKFNMMEKDFWQMSPFLFEEMTRIESENDKKIATNIKGR